MEKVCLGWREWVALPDLGVKRIKVKVDTGARTSALHAEDIRVFRRRGQPKVSFTLYPFQRSRRGAVHVEADLVEKRVVRSSVGVETQRPVIRTHLELAGHRRLIEVTLVNRDIMGFRMLLGREAIKGCYLVDPGHSFLQSSRSGKNGKEVARKK